MADLNALAAAPVQWSHEDTDTNAALSISVAARVQMSHYVTGYSFSVDRAPVTTGSLIIANGANVLDRIEIPAALFSPIVVEFKRPLKCAANTAVTADVGALGASVLATLVLRGFDLRE